MPLGFQVRPMPLVQQVLHGARRIGGPVALRFINGSLVVTMVGPGVRLLIRADMASVDGYDLPDAVEFVTDAEALALAISTVAAAGFGDGSPLTVLVRSPIADPTVTIAGGGTECILTRLDADVPRVDAELAALLTVPRRAAIGTYATQTHELLAALLPPGASAQLFEPIFDLQVRPPPQVDRYTKDSVPVMITPEQRWLGCLCGMVPGFFVNDHVALIADPEERAAVAFEEQAGE